MALYILSFYSEFRCHDRCSGQKGAATNSAIFLASSPSSAASWTTDIGSFVVAKQNNGSRHSHWLGFLTPLCPFLSHGHQQSLAGVTIMTVIYEESLLFTQFPRHTALGEAKLYQVLTLRLLGPPVSPFSFAFFSQRKHESVGDLPEQ